MRGRSGCNGTAIIREKKTVPLKVRTQFVWQGDILNFSFVFRPPAAGPLSKIRWSGTLVFGLSSNNPPRLPIKWT